MLRQVYESLWGLVLPEFCPRCDEPTHGGFCTACRAEFPFNVMACSVCGSGPLQPGRSRCENHAPAWHTDAVLAPYLFVPPLSRYFHELKFAGRRNLGRAAGLLLADYAHPRRHSVAALVSVPLHPERLLRRGYNQALEIARSVSHELHLPILRAGILRSRPTHQQTALDAVERRHNLAAAFTVTRDLRGVSVAIVDDVITTGATVNSLALSLRAAGATHVEAWAVARTPLAGHYTRNT
jgi:ComF family protein